jgi:hypothetical protein
MIVSSFALVVILVLTVIRGKILGAGTQTPVITHLYRTGIGYFLVMFATLIVSAFVAPAVVALSLVPSFRYLKIPHSVGTYPDTFRILNRDGLHHGLADAPFHEGDVARAS